MTTSMQTDYEISCRNIWKIFGPQAEYIKKNLSPELSAAEILEQTGHVVAVKEVTFDVRKGETFVVMGLSGSGKSTLVRCISRLIEPTEGQVIIQGEDVTAMNHKQLRELRRRKMSMVFQHFGLFPHRQIIDNVAYGLEIQGIDRATRYAQAREVLELVSLTGWENHYPAELSGGMQQRVGIARALAVDPSLLLFDEPFSALDPLIRREMQEELIHLQQMMQKTIIFITHDFLEAVKLGDHIAIMKDGEIVQIGTPEEIVTHPANNYVREFAKDVPRSRVLAAGSIMKTYPLVVSETDSPQIVLGRMQNQGIRTAFIQDRNKQFRGTVTLEQIKSAIKKNNGASTLNSVVSNHQAHVSVTTILADLIPIIAATDAPVPVLDEANRLAGFVDRTTIILALSSGEEPTHV